MHRFTKETAAHVLNILDCNLMEKRGGEEGGEEERKREEEEERGERRLGGEGRKRKIRGAEGRRERNYPLYHSSSHCRLQGSDQLHCYANQCMVA